MSNRIQDNKRIAKNTLMLYVRMILVMGVTLYTSRVVLEQLGIVDYGVYNVVAGLVSMLGFLNGSISIAAQRFLAVAIANKNEQELSCVFQSLQAILLIIAVVFIILTESLGLWFLYTYINIPAHSMYAAFWVFQCSVAMAVIGIISVPYIALTVAHERMKIYAYLSILESFLKLSVAFLLIWIHFEKLILYAILVLISSLVIYLAWMLYTRNQYPHIPHRPIYNQTIGLCILKFVGWQTYGSFSYILRTQGINMILNIFFGPVLNAARGIAAQVNSAMLQFVQNFQMAVIPQINKQYAENDTAAVNSLIIRSSKLSFLLMFILSLPILMETRPILELWLKVVPEYGVLFVQLIIVTTLTDLMSGTLVYGALATGNIKKYQSVLFYIYLLALPVVYLCFKLGFPPQTVFYVEMTFNIFCLIVRLLFLNNMMGLSIMGFIRDVIFREIFVVLAAVALSLAIKNYSCDDIFSVAGVILGSFITAIISSFFVGLRYAERNWIIGIIKSKIRH